VLLKQRDWCLLLSWCLVVGIGVSSRLVPTRSVRVGWCLQGFVSVGIGVSSRLVPTNICNSRLVPTNK
jgi:hypothetical protein